MAAGLRIQSNTWAASPPIRTDLFGACKRRPFPGLAGAVGYLDNDFIEYDLDAADKAWLETFNLGQNRLPARRFELLLWRLELGNAAATERTLAGAGEWCPRCCGACAGQMDL